MSGPTKDDILWAYAAVSGEITPEMRMIAFRLQGREALFRFYLDREPSEQTRECAEIIAVNFDAGHAPALTRLDIEFVVSDQPLGKLDPLDKHLFRRWEPYD